MFIIGGHTRLRERGSEGIVCPKDATHPGTMAVTDTSVSVARSFRVGVADDRSRLGEMLHHRAVPASPFRLAVRFGRSHSTAIRLHPAVGYPERCKRGRMSGTLPLSPMPSYFHFGEVSRIGTKKKSRNHGGGIVSALRVQRTRLCDKFASTPMVATAKLIPK